MKESELIQKNISYKMNLTEDETFEIYAKQCFIIREASLLTIFFRTKPQAKHRNVICL